MIIALVLFFGIGLLTMYAVGLVELEPAGGRDAAMEAQVIAMQQAYRAAGQALFESPDTGLIDEADYAAFYPSHYGGHGGAVRVIADGTVLTVYSTDPPRPGAVEKIGFASRCSALVGESVEGPDGSPRLVPACEANAEGVLPDDVPAGRLIIQGAF